jgi:hypothetical protein
MLSPLLEVYVVWHPADRAAVGVADELAAHFHGGVYSSLLAGSMEVYMRSAGWRADADAPRPIAWPGSRSAVPGPAPAEFVAVVPLIGTALNRAASRQGDPWRAWFDALAQARSLDPERVRLFPIRLDVMPGGRLAEIVGTDQYLAEPDAHAALREPEAELRCRDLAQAMAQWISPVAGEQLKVFISHTKRQGTPDEPVSGLVAAVRAVFGSGRVASFYDAQDLKPGADWDGALRAGAASSALLALRTDLYASREWCQREMLTAKVHGMPVVVLDALSAGESRGSFLMDHTPRIPVRRGADGTWGTDAIRRAINLLADAWLQRVLWLRLQQQVAGRGHLGHYWWAPQAPEPSTLARWLSAPLRPTSDASVDAPAPPGQRPAPRMPAQAAGSDLRILHPDPPLAEDERGVLQNIVALAGYGQLDLTTPRLLAARGA